MSACPYNGVLAEIAAGKAGQAECVRGLAGSVNDGKIGVETATNPTRPDAEEIDEEARRILDERSRTFGEDVKGARPANEVLAEIRSKLKPQAPRP